MIECYGQNKVRAQARANILNKEEGRKYGLTWLVVQYKGDWYVVSERLKHILS